MRRLIVAIVTGLAGLFGGWFQRKPADGPELPTTVDAPLAKTGITTLYPCMAGVEQRADGSWWLVIATRAGDVLPDATWITPSQARDILGQLRRTRSA